MANRKKRTEAQKAYQKERRRLLQAIRRGEKQGYIFPEDIVPDLPKRVTKTALKRIKNTKPKDLYKTAEYLYQDTGEVIPAEQRKQEVKREAIRKAKETRKNKQLGTYKVQVKTAKPITSTYYPTISIIDTIRDRLSELTREGKPPIPIEARKNELLRIFEDTVTFYSDNLNELEQYLIVHESEIAGSLYVVSYDSNAEKVAASFVSLARLLNMQSLTPEQGENISAMAEYYNA